MSVIADFHEDLGAEFAEVGGRRVVTDYGRPERTHLAVRNGVGLTEPAYGIVVVEGDDRVEYVDNVVSNRIPAADGEGVYALLLDPQGGIETDAYVYNAGERLLCFTPPDRAGPVAGEWAEKTFIQDVEVREATDEFAVFGVHGPSATEKVASVLNGASTPDRPLSFARGRMDDEGVTVVRTDAPAGEEGYEVVCAAADAEAVYDTLLNHGLNAAPFGLRTWETLTLEAGTPLFDSELRGAIPNEVGIRNALDFEKGCYVGQEVVSRIENRGRPRRRLVGLALDAGTGEGGSDAEAASEGPGIPDPSAAVFVGDAAVGEVTRAAYAPSLDRPAAMALVDSDADLADATVRVDGRPVGAEPLAFPLVAGSERSARIPSY